MVFGVWLLLLKVCDGGEGRKGGLGVRWGLGRETVRSWVWIERVIILSESVWFLSSGEQIAGVQTT